MSYYYTNFLSIKKRGTVQYIYFLLIISIYWFWVSKTDHLSTLTKLDTYFTSPQRTSQHCRVGSLFRSRGRGDWSSRVHTLSRRQPHRHWLTRSCCLSGHPCPVTQSNCLLAHGSYLAIYQRCWKLQLEKDIHFTAACTNWHNVTLQVFLTSNTT